MRPRLGHFVRARLHRRIFVWFGASILFTGVTVALMMALVSGVWSSPWKREFAAARTFVGGRFARVWDDPPERDALARAMAEDLATDVTVTDAGRRPLVTAGQPCARPAMTAPVVRGGETVGYVLVCVDRQRPRNPWRFILPFVIALATLWAASGKIARRLARPLSEVARVAEDIGAGRLSSRARLGRHEHGEAKVLADAINDMAERIERQMADQRELLAAVSHEIRTPLSRIRLLAELARSSQVGGGSPDPKTLDEIDREVVEIDALVGELLASSRLDFAALTPARLDAVEVARRAVERAGLPEGALAIDGEPGAFLGDPTLVARALANLIDNAEKHGGGVESLCVAARPGAVAFEALDRGSGFEPGEELLAFASFYSRAGERAGEQGSLGLGLALVKRIAEAHGGRAYASNREGGGARVGIELSVEGPKRESPGDRAAAAV